MCTIWFFFCFMVIRPFYTQMRFLNTLLLLFSLAILGVSGCMQTMVPETTTAASTTSQTIIVVTAAESLEAVTPTPVNPTGPRLVARSLSSVACLDCVIPPAFQCNMPGFACNEANSNFSFSVSWPLTIFINFERFYCF